MSSITSLLSVSVLITVLISVFLVIGVGVLVSGSSVECIKCRVTFLSLPGARFLVSTVALSPLGAFLIRVLGLRAVLVPDRLASPVVRLLLVLMPRLLDRQVLPVSPGVGKG
jgi:hypothetical protein